MTCQICGAENAETHFGGISCRACAAFFRRYVNSKKLIIQCTCKQRTEKSYPCRRCRMNKCLAVGMTKTKVQSSREKNTRRVIPSSELATLSLLSCHIVPKFCFKIAHTIENLGFLTAKDREAIICNFFPRWIVMESSIDYCTNQEHHRKMMDNSEELEKMIVKFYGSSMERRKPDKEIVNIFKPYWVHFYNEIAESVFQMKLDKVECIALFLMILFDDAYTNISEEGAKLCRNLRKVVLRELKGYQTDNNLPEKRLLDVMSTLMLLEKGEEKMQEEIILCGLNNVNLHDDFKSIVQVKKL
ncbi:hypothetical protein L5515_008484 [Caenorhabditis briggsae]|uniref:Nuclear receptor domain-containing protein n=1 Tax=Caenorhabditis briggsae TaxID=6238 RepID=A0AAE9F6C5_CAEBR|nr:hypothetical protein L5515_008484 [Caenorhabditis briggsae]